MRKASREMDATFALEVLDKAPYVTVSMTRPDGTPYGLPLSLARTDEKTFYFHCALEGDKLDCIAHCPTVFLSAVTKCAPTVGPKDGSFTLQYRSATAIGKAEIVTDREEKITALRAICQRFLPHHMDAVDELPVLVVLGQVQLHPVNHTNHLVPAFVPFIHRWTPGGIGTTDKGIQQ